MKRILFTVLLLGIVIVSEYKWECLSYFSDNCKPSLCDEDGLCFAMECDKKYLCTQYATLVDRNCEIITSWGQCQETFLFRIKTDTKSVSEIEMKKMVDEKIDEADRGKEEGKK